MATSTPSRTKTARNSDGSALLFSQIQAPATPLLDAAAERFLGRRVSNGLKRLRRLVAVHPEGYRQVLDKLERVLRFETSTRGWKAFGDQVREDNEASRADLEEATRRSEGDAVGARKLVRRGAARFEKYPLKPEEICRWARAVLAYANLDSLDAVCHGDRLRDLIRRALRSVESGRDALLEANLRLILKESLRLRPRGLEASDLYQEGVVGLTKACLRFDPELRLRFSTYASYWIRQSILKAMQDQSCMIRVPSGVQERVLRDDEAEAASREGERERIKQLLFQTTLFSAASAEGESDGDSFEQGIAAAADNSRQLRAEHIPSQVAVEVEHLGRRESYVVARRFGIAGQPRQTLTEIGKDLNLSRERVRQIETYAIERLRQRGSLAELFENLEEVDNPTPIPA